MTEDRPNPVMAGPRSTLPYVPSHLHHMTFELVKNSLRAVQVSDSGGKEGLWRGRPATLHPAVRHPAGATPGTGGALRGEGGALPGRGEGLVLCVHHSKHRGRCTLARHAARYLCSLQHRLSGRPHCAQRHCAQSRAVCSCL